MMGHSREGPDFFREKYARPRSEAAGELERAVLGQEVGINGYTTIEQARNLAGRLSLSSDTHLLDLGAGRGWPGSYLARISGCRLVLSDIPIEALHEARRWAAERGVAGRMSAACADGLALPFATHSFDAIVHTDVFC